MFYQQLSWKYMYMHVQYIHVSTCRVMISVKSVDRLYMYMLCTSNEPAHAWDLPHERSKALSWRCHTFEFCSPPSDASFVDERSLRLTCFPALLRQWCLRHLRSSVTFMVAQRSWRSARCELFTDWTEWLRLFVFAATILLMKHLLSPA